MHFPRTQCVLCQSSLLSTAVVHKIDALLISPLQGHCTIILTGTVAGIPKVAKGLLTDALQRLVCDEAAAAPSWLTGITVNGPAEDWSVSVTVSSIDGAPRLGVVTAAWCVPVTVVEGLGAALVWRVPRVLTSPDCLSHFRCAVLNGISAKQEAAAAELRDIEAGFSEEDVAVCNCGSL